MTTPLYSTFRKRIEDATQRIIRDQVTPWVFLTAGRPLKIKQFSGQEILYEGLDFEGSPRTVFWGKYIDPFLEDLVVEEIAFAISSAKERRVNAKLLLPEVRNLLVNAVQNTFESMVDIDRRLRGKGYPDSVAPRSVEGEVGQLCAFIDERVQCELAMWKPKSALEEWYERNKFLVWVVGTILTVAGLAAKFL